VPEETLWPYAENRERFMPTHRIPCGFQDAVDAIEQLVRKSSTSSVSCSHIFRWSDLLLCLSLWMFN